MKKIIFLFAFVFFIFFMTKLMFAEGECLTVGFWIEDSTYDYFDPAKNTYSRNTFEQWADKQMTSWNKILIASGARDCFRISKIVRVRDGQLPLGPKENFPTNMPDFNDRTVDIQWGFPRSWLDMQIRESPQIFYGIDWGLLHELSHARYLIDEYVLNLDTSRDKIEVTDPSGKSIIGNYIKPIGRTSFYHNKSQDLMGGDLSKDYFYYSHSAQALNLIAGQHNAVQYGNFNHPSNIGVYLDDLPKENILRVTDDKGNPLNGATIRIFQSVILPNAGYGAKKIDNIADIVGATDSDGLVSVGSNPFGVSGLGYLNKKISPYLVNGIFILEIFENNQLEYKVIEVSDFNLAYWNGATERAVYEIKTNFIIPGSPCPRGIVDEKEYKCSFGGLDNHCPLGFTEETSFACSAAGSTPKYCCSQPVVTTTPTPIPTITIVPTPDFSRGDVNFQVKFIDENGNDLVLNDQQVVLKNLSTGKTLVNEGQMSDWGYWVFSGLPFLTSYEITAQPIPGYNISSSTCINCNFHPNYTNQNSVVVDVPSAALFVEVYFKFTKTPFFTPTPISSNPITSTPTTVMQIPTINSNISTKKLVGIIIDGKPIDLNNPLLGIHLPGREGEANKFIIQVIVTYSDASFKSVDLVFDYSPLQSLTPTSTSIPIPSNAPILTPDTNCDVIQNGTEYFCVDNACPSGSTASANRLCFNQVCCSKPVSAVTPTPTPIQTTSSPTSSSKYLCTVNFYRSFVGCSGRITKKTNYCKSTDDSRSVCDDTLTTISCVTSSSCGN